MMPDEERLTADDFYIANDVWFMKAYPQVRRRLIQNEQIHKPKECVECIFFRWLFGEDKRICGGQCAAKPEIEQDKFEYGKVAEGCPLHKEGR